MKFSALALSAFLACSGAQAWAQSNAIPGSGVTAQVNDLSSVAITGTGGITVTARIGPDALPPSSAANSVPVDNTPAGLAYVAGNETFSGTEISPTDSIPSPGQTTTGPTSGALYTLTKTAVTVPAAGASDALVGYGTVTNTPTPYWTYPAATAGLTPGAGSGSYSGLAYAADNFSLGSGTTSNSLYMIHHLPAGDYFSTIIYTSENVVDLKLMSGGAAPLPLSGYLTLTYGTSVPGTAGNNMWYLRTAGASDHLLANGTPGAVVPPNDILFGYFAPALLSGSYDLIDLNAASTKGSFGGSYAALTGYTTLTFLPTVPSVGNYTGNVFYYLRQDASVANGGTGNTILGKLDPTVGLRTISDIANLGAVYSTLVFAPANLGITTGGGVQWGTNQLYVTGLTPKTAQSVSFAAIPDQTANGSGVYAPFTVTPTASSNLPIVLTVLAASTGTATITGPVSGTWTVTPTGSGIITLKASQAGQAAAPVYSANFMEQSFNATGPAVITNSPLTAPATIGSPFNFAITALGSPTTFTAGANLPIGLSIAAATGIISGTPSVGDATGAIPVTITASNGVLPVATATLTITVAAANSPPVITNLILSAAGTIGQSFSFPIQATGAAPLLYAAPGLPSGLTVNSATGVISGTPSIGDLVGLTNVTIGVSNGINPPATATLAITLAAPSSSPSITNFPLSAAGALGQPFGFQIVATGTAPLAYSATGLPPGLSVNAVSGVINGLPTVAGVFFPTLTASNGIGSPGSATLTITIAPPGSAPFISNNALSAAGTVGTPFGFAIVATPTPSSYGATGLPPGLSVNTLTGAIGGTPTTAGTSVVLVSATNGNGTNTATLTITVAPATIAPIITSPRTAPGTVGTPFITYLIAATGLPTSYTATGLPPGLTLNPLTGAINGTPATAGTYVVTLTATNSAGTSTSTLTIVVAATAVAPIITSPTTEPAIAGTPFVTYLIGATGLPTSYTATGLPAGLTLNPLTGAINGTPTTAGTYVVTLTATNSTGTSTSTLTITVGAAAFSRIVNFSARAQAGSGSQTLVLGFVVSGVNKALLVRGDGPALTPFGVINALPDPQLTLFSASGQIATNTGWSTGGNGPALVATAAQLGAFPLAAGSGDSALITVVSTGSYTSQIVGASGDTGTALAEVYDADNNLAARLVNASARMEINLAGGNLNPLTIGFVILGNNPKTVLIRGIGPGLSAFGVAGALANPQITLFSGSTQIATNSNWSVGNTVSQITATFAQVGAFALASGSLDAALTATLQPGTYTVQITGVGNTSGVALVEIYDVQ